MYEIDVCYKIIFEAMLEDTALEEIADRINEYTDAEVIIVSGSGKILAYSHVREDEKNEWIRQKHITLKEYEHFQRAVCTGEENMVAEEVELSGRFKGYVIIRYKEKEETSFFKELAQVIGQAVKGYLEEERKGYIYVQPLKKSVMAWELLYGPERESWEKQEDVEPPYIGILVQKRELKEKDVLWLKSLSEIYCVYEDRNEIFGLFSGLNEKNISAIYKKIEEQKIACSVSEPFYKLEWCASKYRLLKRMSAVADHENDSVMKREKEWSVQGLYTYTLPLIEAAGLSDYRIIRLLREDEANNTDLYYTLKVYLLNGNNVTLAAENLHIHRNTMVYRLKQIKECMEVDVNDNEISRELLSFMMMYDISRQKKERHSGETTEI